MNKLIKDDLWYPIIGLEIHVKVNSNRKLFSESAGEFPYDQYNQYSDFYAAGVPGVYPYLNTDIIRQAIKFGLCINAVISDTLLFDRKLYFYHDLPKNFQITQRRRPLITNGTIRYTDVHNTARICKIQEAHVEEDTCITKHLFQNAIGIDCNRSSCGLLEIVTAPDIIDCESAALAAETIRDILVYQNISSCKMNFGEMRIDCNISIKKDSDHELRNKIEIKNINSFNFMDQALKAAYEQQIAFYKEYGDEAKLPSETYKWDSGHKKLIKMREKNTDIEYCYLPEPDVPTLIIPQHVIDNIESSLVDMPEELRSRYIFMGLSSLQAASLTTHPSISNLYNAVCKETAHKVEAGNWIVLHVLGCFTKKHVMHQRLPHINAQYIAYIINTFQSGLCLKQDAVKAIKDVVLNNNDPTKTLPLFKPKDICEDFDISEIIHNTVQEHSSALSNYLAGNPRSLHFLIGQIMSKVKGRMSADKVAALLIEYTKKHADS